MTKRLFFLAVGLLTATPDYAQSFTMRADVGRPGQSGYHRIMLPPDVVGRLNADLTDIRLYDKAQREVPYQLTRRQPGQSAKRIDLEIVSRTSTPKKTTTLVLRNRQRSQLRAITLIVKNTDSRKLGQLSGSFDAQTWYALRDAIPLDPAPTTQTTAGLRIDIPTSDYYYYRLTIGDSLSDPLNILRADYDATTVSPGTYTPIDRLSFNQRDSSDHQTYLRITRPAPARFDRVKLEVATAGPFSRNAIIGQYQVRKRRRNRMERYFEVIQTFPLSGTDSNLVYLPTGLSTRELYVLIDNADNPPLTVRAVQGFQTTTYLTANLAAGTDYQLRFSANDIAPPVYDLSAFENLPASPGFVSVTNVRPIGAVVGEGWGLIAPPWLIWVGLGLVLALLGYFSVRMLREMGGQKG